MAVLPAVLAVATAGSTIYGGLAASQAANSQAKLTRAQGALEQQNALDNATTHATEVRKFAAKQKLAYIASGVNFSGSALNVQDETISTGQKEVDAMTRQGNAYATLANQEAKITQNKGRAALIGSFGGASSGLYDSYKKGDFNGL